MTKINDNGQLEFTFEELDFVGAEFIVMKEIYRLDKNIESYKAIGSYRNTLYLRKEKMYEVLVHIRRLMQGLSLFQKGGK